MDNLIIFYLTLLSISFIESSYLPSNPNRFPHLQRVLERIATDTRQYSSVSPYHHPVTESPYRHPGKSQDRKQDEDYDDEDEEEEDEEVHTESHRKPPSRMPIRAVTSIPEMSPYSKHKWDSYGNRQALDKIRNAQMTSTKSPPRFSVADDQEAKRHAIRVNQEGQCRHPRVKIIRVSDVHPNAGKTYVPECTILFRCGDDTGCCRTTHSCVAKKSHKVELLFHSTFHGGASGNQVERLIFTNDTECMCQDKRYDMMPRDMEVNGGHQTPTTLQRHHPRTGTCRCPKLFSVRHLSSGVCSCDCFDNDKECIRQKKGREYLTHDDKQCIARQLCQPPSCEYGHYRAVAGRCSKRHERHHSEY